MTDVDKAIRAAKLTLGAVLDKRHAKTAVERAQGQIAPSKYLPNVPRQVHADGGSVTDNENFQNWFGNSVTHTNGEPHVFYTGTSKDNDFTSHNVGRHGAWFTRDPAEASSYAEQNDSQGYKRDGWNMVKTNTASRVIPAYVKAENPYTGELPEEYLRDNYKAAQSDWFDTLRAKGHDAWMPASQNGNLVVALKEPQQIKSIFNNGKFDPKQKHMNKADGGRIHANKGGSMGARDDFLVGNHPEVPNVVYHSTKGNFHQFHPLSHFGTRLAAHDRYSPDMNLLSGVSIIPAHIRMKKPLDMGTERGWMDNSDMLHDVADRLDRSHPEVADKIREHADWLMDNDKSHGSHEGLQHQAAAAGLIKTAGYDGLIYTNTEEDPGSRSFVTLGPEQVKSAIGNRGTFDPTDPDMTKADGGRTGYTDGGVADDDNRPIDLGVARALRRFNQNSDGPPPEVEGIFNRLAAAKDAAQEAHEAAHKAGAFDSAQIGDVFKYKPLDSYAPMKVIGHGMEHVSRWGGINPPKYVYNDHFPVAHFEYQDARKERGSRAVELLEDRNLYNFISGKPRIARADGGRLSLYSKAAQIIRGMKDQPMQAADIVKYALGKGAKRTEIAHVNVPPGKATPSQVAEHIEFMQPQIGVHKRETFYRYNDPERYERQINYLEGQGRYDEAEELNREFEAFEGYGGKDAPIYAKYQLPGGENYREHVLTLDSHPDDQTYTAPIHWGKLKNPLAHIRMSDRMIGNKKILHIEEMQSDWNNDARKVGFRTGREKQDYEDYVAQMRQKAIDRVKARTGQDYYDPMTGETAPTMSPMVAQAQIEKYQRMDPYTLALKMGMHDEHRRMADAAKGGSGVPRAPYINPEKDDVYEMAMKHVLMEAAKGGYDGITFTPDEAQELRWPGHTFKGIYNKRLPGIAQRLVQPHDPDNDVDDMTHLSGWAVPMIPLSDKARDSITQNGFSSFRRGGMVGAALAATRRFTKDGQHVTMRLKD